jgi:hypothetical protein
VLLKNLLASSSGQMGMAYESSSPPRDIIICLPNYTAYIQEDYNLEEKRFSYKDEWTLSSLNKI